MIPVSKWSGFRNGGVPAKASIGSGPRVRIQAGAVRNAATRAITQAHQTIRPR